MEQGARRLSRPVRHDEAAARPRSPSGSRAAPICSRSIRRPTLDEILDDEANAARRSRCCAPTARVVARGRAPADRRRSGATRCVDQPLGTLGAHAAPDVRGVVDAAGRLPAAQAEVDAAQPGDHAGPQRAARRAISTAFLVDDGARRRSPRSRSASSRRRSSPAASRRSSTTARKVSDGHLDARVELRGTRRDGRARRRVQHDARRPRRTRAAQVEYLQRIGAWQDVARRLAHEIKNPLTPIQLAVQQTVSSYKGDDARFKQLLDDTERDRRGGDRGPAPARRHVPHARPAAQGREGADRARRGDRGAQARSRRSPRSSSSTPPAEPVTVRADKLLLKRVLANLVENGIHAGARGGHRRQGRRRRGAPTRDVGRRSPSTISGKGVADDAPREDLRALRHDEGDRHRPRPRDRAQDRDRARRRARGLAGGALGYYSRVKNLQTAVKEVHESYGGVVPNSKEEFGKLKGVGPYTTGAVLSIAYGNPLPAVDGNVMRVFSRIFNIDDDISKTKTRKLFEELTAEVISQEDPSSFNQGLMDLGATICIPKNPACLLCPVREFCRGFHEGTQNDLPVKAKQKKGKTIQYVAAVLEDDDNNIMIRQRPDQGLLASLWEFPNTELNEKTPNLIQVFEKDMEKQYEIMVDLEEPIGVIEHVFSHLTWKIHVFQGKIRGKITESENIKAVPFDNVEDYPFPVPYQKVWKGYKNN